MGSFLVALVQGIKQFLARPINILVLLFLLYMVYNRWPSWQNSFELQGQNMQSYELQNLTGSSLLVPPNDGKASVLLFWATWCEPCHLELWRFQEAINSGDLDSSRVFAINMGEAKETVMATANEREYSFQLYLDPQYSLAKLYGVLATPTVVLINAQGQIDWVASGISPTAVLRAKNLFKN